jgi:hypothetical protein
MQRQSRLFASAITLVFLAGLAVTPASRAVADDDQEEGAVGTWIGKATFDNPPGTPPGSPQLKETELASIHYGGIVTGTSEINHSSQNPFVPPGLRVELSDYFGSWAPMGDSDRIAVTFKRLLFLGPNFDP